MPIVTDSLRADAPEVEAAGKVYYSTKTYGTDRGLSCCFRQHKARSHCKKFHGYALGVSITFAASELDDQNWVVDFGSLGSVWDWLEDTFDHKLIVAIDDPNIEEFNRLDWLGLADVVTMDNVGCEAFALAIFNQVKVWLEREQDAGFLNPSAQVHSVTVFEHGSNSATVKFKGSSLKSAHIH